MYQQPELSFRVIRIIRVFETKTQTEVADFFLVLLLVALLLVIISNFGYIVRVFYFFVFLHL